MGGVNYNTVMFIINVFVDLTFKLIMDVHNTDFHKGPVHQNK